MKHLLAPLRQAVGDEAPVGGHEHPLHVGGGGEVPLQVGVRAVERVQLGLEAEHLQAANLKRRAISQKKNVLYVGA